MATAINAPLNVNFQNGSQLTREIQGSVDRVKFNLGGEKGFRSLSQPLGRLTGQADEFSKSLDAANARVLAFGASVGVVNAVANAFKSLVNSTIEVEKAITAISVVGDQFNGKTKELSQGLFNIAKNTGQSFAEVSKAALEFARQGQGVEETLKRTNDALILTRSTGLDAAKSVEGISAAVSAFAKAGLTTAQVINKLAAVDKAFKVSSADLIQAFERTGAVAQQAGVSFDELAGIVTALQNDTSRGGAVIGNALKTIFSRLQDTSTLTQLQDLGVAVQDLQGNLLPARQILQNLAGDVQGLSKVTQAGIFKDVAGTFQLNQLVSLVNDLNKAKSVSATATEISTGATNEAYVANEKLNQSLDALLNKVAITGKQLGSILGEIGLTDNLKGLLDGVNSFLEDVNGVLQGDDIGSNFAKGFVKGIGAVLSGPGLGIFLAIIAKLSYDLLRFGTESLKTFFGIGKAANDQKQIQESIVQTLLKNQNVLNSILSAQGGQNAQGLKFLGILNQQAAAMQSIQGLAGNIAGTVYSAGYRQTDRGLARKAAGGYLPAQEASDVRRGVGGASPSSKVVSIPNFAFGGGKRGTMVANTSEYIVPNYAGGGSAIFNQDMVKTMGLPAGAKKIGAAGGFVPNFSATNKLKAGRDLESRIFNFFGLPPAGNRNLDFPDGVLTGVSPQFKNKIGLQGAFGDLKLTNSQENQTSLLGRLIQEFDLFDELNQSLYKKKSAQNIDLNSLNSKVGRASLFFQGNPKIFEKSDVSASWASIRKANRDKPNFLSKFDPIIYRSDGALKSGAIGSKVSAKILLDGVSDPQDAASNGYIPNFADFKNSDLAVLGLYGNNGNIDGSPVYTLQNQRPEVSKDIVAGYKNRITGFVNSYARQMAKKVGIEVSPKEISKSLSQASNVSGFIFEDVLNQLAGPNFDSNRISGGARADFPLTSNLRKVFGVSGTQKYAEIKLSPSNTDAVASIRAKQAALAGGALAPIETSPAQISALREEAIALGIGQPGRVDTKTQARRMAFIQKMINSGMIKSGYGASADQTKAIKRTLGMASSGYIPNFAAAALQQAIAREKSAGLSNSQIYVDQNSSLKSPLNPMGLMVANTRDEPFGGIQGISRARNEGANPKTYGAANGFVPNYASSLPRAQIGTVESVLSKAEQRSVGASSTSFNQALKDIAKELQKNKITLQQAEKNIQQLANSAKISTTGQKKLAEAGNKLINAYSNDLQTRKQKAKELTQQRKDSQGYNSKQDGKGFGDLAGKLIVAQTAMSFFSGSVEGATDTTSKWINALSQTIGSLVQFGFLLSTTGLGGKIGKTLQGLGKGIGLDRLAKAGGGLIGKVGSFAAGAAGPVGLAVSSAYLVNTIGESIKGLFKKDLSATFDRLQKSADEVSASFTDLDKKTNITAKKEAYSSLTGTERIQEILSFGLRDTVSAYGGAYTGTEMNEQEIEKTISAVISAGVARGLSGDDLKKETDKFLTSISKPNLNLNRKEIDLTNDKNVESLDFYLKESAAIGENTKKRKELQDAQKLAVIQDTQYNDRIKNTKNAISALNAQLKSLRDLVQSVEIGAMFEKFNNKSVVDLNNGLSSAARGVREFENSIKEIKIDTETEKFKKLSEALIDINKKVQVKAVDFGSDVGGAALDAVAKIQEAIQGGDFEKLRATFTANAQQLGGVFTSKEVEDLSRSLQEQLDDLDRQRVIKEQQQRLDFVSKNLNEQNSLILEKQNSVLEKRLGLIEKEFEFKKKTNDIDRQISDAKFETGLIGKSRTEQLTSQRGRVAETQKRANEDVIRELQQQLVDSIKAIEIPTTLSPEAQQNLKAQRNATVSGILQQPAGRNAQEQVNNLTKLGGGLASGLIATIADQEQKASDYAFDQTIEAANGFANIILASAVDLSSSLNNAMNALKVPNLQEELNKAKSNVQKQTELSSALGRATGNKNKSQGLIDAENKVKEITDKINAITQQGSSTSQAQATKKAQAEVNARVEKMRADQAAAATAAAAIKVEEQKNAITQDGIVASKKLVLDAALAKKAAKEFNQSLLELGDSFTNLKNLVRDYIEGLPASLANLQFGALQSTSANDLSSNLIRQQVIKDSEALNPAGVSGSFEDQKKQTEFVAAQTAWREKSFELATAEGAVRRFELEFELKYLEKFLKLKEEGASVEKLAALEREKNAEKRTFGYGFDKGLSTVEERIDNYRTTLGEEIPNLFSSNLAQGLNDAISGAKDLKTALTDAATAFFQEITRKNISNLADMATKGLGSLAETGFSALKSAFPGGVTTKASGGFIKGGSGTKDDVPAMLMGGEYVVKKSAVSKYGKGFLDAINSGSMRGYATGGMVDPQTFPTQTGRGGFYTPGDYGQGAITGKNELLTFASQSFTGGQYDYMGGFGMGGATVSLEPESARLSALGREGSPMFERVQQSKDEAFRVYLEGLQKEKEYSELLDQIAKDKKARKKELQRAIISAVISSALSYAGTSMKVGAANASAAGGSKFAGAFMGSGGKGGLFNIAKGAGTSLTTSAKALEYAKIAPLISDLPAQVSKQAFTARTKSLSSSNLSLPQAISANTNFINPLLPQLKAAGGLISGGSNVRDDVPAMLTGGEFVLNNRATQRLGVQNLNKLNSGAPVSSEGGASAEMTQALVSKLDELIQATSNSSKENVVVNVSTSEAGNQTSENPAGAEKELHKKIRQAVLDVIAQEKRLGGSLEKSR
jgi:TP901 family phage tail tape measure protein